MSKCEWCNQEMGDYKGVITCLFPKLKDLATGEVKDRLPYLPEGYEGEFTRRCHDCNVAVGGFHHPGCDMEICPFCGEQLIACGCELEPIQAEEGTPPVEANSPFWARYEEILARLQAKGFPKSAAWHDLAVELWKENEKLRKEVNDA